MTTTRLERLTMNFLFVFDVESIGLHGEGFAVGFVVVDSDGNRVDSGLFSCEPSQASGNEEGVKWVKANVPPLLVTHEAPCQMRAAFWKKWRDWKAKGAMLFADCAWPVEARFLAACVDDHFREREWEGPYPLHEIASVIWACGGDPMLTRERREDELPEHNPLADAIQSARLLFEALKFRHSPRWRDRPNVPGMWACIGKPGEYPMLPPTLLELTTSGIESGAPFHVSRVFGPIPHAPTE